MSDFYSCQESSLTPVSSPAGSALSPPHASNADQESDGEEYVLIEGINQSSTPELTTTHEGVKDIWEDDEWERVNLQLRFYTIMQQVEALEESASANSSPDLIKALSAQKAFLAGRLEEHAMVPWTLSKLTKRATSLCRALQDRIEFVHKDEDVDDSALATMGDACSKALASLSRSLHEAHVNLSDCPPLPVPLSSDESEAPPVVPSNPPPIPPPSLSPPNPSATPAVGEGEAVDSSGDDLSTGTPADCTAHRLVDEGIVEDGSFRSPLSGMFPAHLEVLTLPVALTPLMAARPYLVVSCKIAEKHAMSMEESRFFSMSVDERAAVVLYTMEEVPKENSVRTQAIVILL
jgi:hypothetical protein